MRAVPPKDGNPVHHKRPRNNYIAHDGRRFVYLWIHKVACSSIKDALLPLFDLDPKPFTRTLRDGTRHVVIHDMFRRSDYQIQRRRFLDGLHDYYAEHFKFAFVRNPFDRLVSCYRDKIDRQNVPGYILKSAQSIGEEFYPRMPFPEFARIVCRVPNRWADGHFRPQHMTVCGRGGNVIADFVGRFENLAEDFEHVKERIGAPELSLPERNRKAPQDPSYRDHYDDALRELVAKRYRRDLKTFDYSF
jgi:hypothetical protein